MTKPFKVGDQVRFELDKNGTLPRWNFGEDDGPSGQFVTGIIIDPKPLKLVDSILVNYTIVNNTRWQWEWPNEEHPERDGWIQLWNPTQQMNFVKYQIRQVFTDTGIIANKSTQQTSQCDCGNKDGRSTCYNWCSTKSMEVKEVFDLARKYIDSFRKKN